MNRNVYRLVFNKIRGFLMAVAECTSSRCKSSRDTPSVKKSGRTFCFVLRSSYISLMVGLGLLTFLVPTQAQVVAYKNAPGNQQPTIMSGQNGVPIVNIQTPSAAGVSRNVYSQFDVNANGVVMNNSRTNTQTQLVGWLQGNPQLAGGTAKIILNEVNSSNPSLLNGFVEIGGDKAQFVLANPAGISCAGCGFINANRVTLTTGTPLINGGQLDGYRVQNGVISISGNGMSADQAGYTDLITRAVEVNAGIWANQLSITTGVNVVNAINTQAAQVQASDAPPRFAIDVAQLGGMYANKIILVGTEAGVGVRNMGTLGASVGEVAITADGKLENSGRIIGTQATRIDTQQINNAGMIATQGQLNLNTRGILDNSLSGQIIAGGHARINAETINNNRGKMTSGDTFDLTTANTLHNAEGQIVTNGEISLKANTVDNTAGQIASVLGGITINAINAISSVGGRIESTAQTSLTSQQTNNTEGLIAGESVNITTETLENTQGQLLADAAISLQASNAKNNSGLIRAGGQLILTADTLDNSQTQANEQGIEGESITINTGTIDNTSGAIRANDQLEIISHGNIINQQGEISSVDTLTIHDTQANRTLTLLNTDGILLAGSQLSLETASLSGNGALLAQGNLIVDLTTDFIGSGSIRAGNDLTLSTVGKLSYSGKLQAGNTLTVSAAEMNNLASGEITAGNTQITVANTLNNRGLIDGGITALESATLNNIGTGRIYGDYLSIGASALNNGAETVSGIEKSSVIAARDTLDIGAQTINNSAHSLIFSAGDLYLGGGLDEFGMVTGSAQTLTNTGATIEALGSVEVKAKNISNNNANFVTEMALISQVNKHEHQGQGSPYRYDHSQARTEHIRDNFYRWVIAGSPYDQSYEYIYTRTITEEQVKQSDPGRILAGGNISLESTSILNDKSEIVAGGTLTANATTLENTDYEGVRRVKDSGTMYHYIDHQPPGGGNDWTQIDTYPYAPSAQEEQILLTPTVYQSHGAVNGSGTQLAEVSQTTLDEAPTGTASVTRTNPSAPTLPSSSLFNVHPESTAGYLIETDPRFASYRQWISSDYMLSQLSIDPALTQKRLGDGFYEQRLINEQIAQLTGRRFLEGYSDQETQYTALMSAGVSLAKEWNLIPGISLTAEQVAQLTSDMVWLVEKSVTLPDGSTQQVLVPQLYARLQEGDLTPSGALLSANTVDFQLTGDLLNQGTLAGREVLSLSAENIKNLGGQMSANLALLNAQNDVINRGGSISATDALLVEAGRNITVESTTTESGEQESGKAIFNHQNINRVAGLYVTGKGGTLIASAGNDLNLIAGLVSNSGKDGQTLLTAGNDINLQTVNVSQGMSFVQDERNYHRQNATQSVGAAIHTEGELTLTAGNDLTARAATLSSQGMVSLTAARDIRIEAATDTLQLDAASHITDQGNWGTSQTISTRDVLDQRTTTQSRLAAETIQIHAGQDINVAGSQITAQEQLALSAGRAIEISTAQGQQYQESARQVDRSGFFSSKTNTAQDRESRTTQTGSEISGKTVQLAAGQDLRIHGSNVISDEGTTLQAGNNLTISAAQNQQSETHYRKEEESGLLSSGGIGFTIGTREQGSDGRTWQNSALASTLGAINGDVMLIAGKDYTQTGSHVLAPGGNILVAAENIAITDARESTKNTTDTWFKQSGLTVAITSPVISAIQTVNQLSQAASNTSDGRMKALAAANIALTTKGAADAIKAGQGTSMQQADGSMKDNQLPTGATKADGTPTGETRDATLADQIGGINLSISLGTSQSESHSHYNSNTAAGSTLSAGGDITLVATGAGDGKTSADSAESSKSSSGNILIQGSDLTAGKNLTLVAENDIKLLAARNESQD